MKTQPIEKTLDTTADTPAAPADAEQTIPPPPAKSNSIKVDSGVRLLPCVLTDAERLEIGTRSARAHFEVARLTEDAKTAASDYKAKIGTVTAALTADMQAISSGIQMRDVETEHYRNHSLGRYIIVRVDTGEEVDSRPLTPNELQLRMTDLDSAEGPMVTNAEAVATRFNGMGRDDEGQAAA